MPTDAGARLDSALGLTFRDPDLLLQALTHSSWVNEHGDATARDNERLEYLGDAVLGMIVAELVYREYPDYSEGMLTQLRAALVRAESLAGFASNMGLGEQLRIGRGEERNGGRQRASILCGAYEAVVGALYLDQGLDAARDFAMPRLKDRLQRVVADGKHIDARSALQELTQAQWRVTPRYRLVDMDGPDHLPVFRVEALIGETVAAEGYGSSKPAAAMAAARIALKRVRAGELTLDADNQRRRRRRKQRSQTR